MKIPDYLMLLFGKVPRIGGNPKPEDKECLDFAERLRKWTMRQELSCIWCHVANEFSGNMKPIYGALKTSMGRVKGAPDYWFIGIVSSFVIEMKIIDSKGRPTKQNEHQIAFQFWCEALNIPYYVCYSADEAEAILRKEGVLQ